MEIRKNNISKIDQSMRTSSLLKKAAPFVLGIAILNIGGCTSMIIDDHPTKAEIVPPSPQIKEREVTKGIQTGNAETVLFLSPKSF